MLVACIVGVWLAGRRWCLILDEIIIADPA